MDGIGRQACEAHTDFTGDKVCAPDDAGNCVGCTSIDDESGCTGLANCEWSSNDGKCVMKGMNEATSPDTDGDGKSCSGGDDEGCGEHPVGWSGPGEGSNWCNTCTCMEGGMMACTAMACIGDDPNGGSNGGGCLNGKQRVEDGWSGPCLAPGNTCNTCQCTEGGLLTSTRMLCEDSNDGAQPGIIVGTLRDFNKGKTAVSGIFAAACKGGSTDKGTNTVSMCKADLDNCGTCSEGTLSAKCANVCRTATSLDAEEVKVETASAWSSSVLDTLPPVLSVSAGGVTSGGGDGGEEDTAGNKRCMVGIRKAATVSSDADADADAEESQTATSLHDSIHCAADIPTLLASLPTDIKEIQAVLAWDHHDQGLSVQQVEDLKAAVKEQIEGYSRALSGATLVVADQIAACTEDECTEEELEAFESIKSENEAEVAKASAMLTAMSSTAVAADDQVEIEGDGNGDAAASGARAALQAFRLGFVALVVGSVVSAL